MYLLNMFLKTSEKMVSKKDIGSMLVQVGILHVQLQEQEQLKPLHLCCLQPALPGLGQFIELVNMFMCKTLGPYRVQFLSDMLPRKGSSRESDSARCVS